MAAATMPWLSKVGPEIMFVALESTARHLRLQEAFGLPEPADRNISEIFGPYELDGQLLFWCYDGEHATWNVMFAETPYDKLWVDLEAADHEALVERFETLRDLPRPNFPATPNVLHRGERFEFNGLTFAWYWVPELGRWELAATN